MHGLCYCLVSHGRLFCGPMDLQPARLLYPWDFSGKNAGMGCHFLFQRFFLTQESNWCLLHCRRILYHWATREAHVWAMSSTYKSPFSPWEHYIRCLDQRSIGLILPHFADTVGLWSLYSRRRTGPQFTSVPDHAFCLPPTPHPRVSLSLSSQSDLFRKRLSLQASLWDTI